MVLCAAANHSPAPTATRLQMTSVTGVTALPIDNHGKRFAHARRCGELSRPPQETSR
jgi:hypothetical protein